MKLTYRQQILTVARWGTRSIRIAGYAADLGDGARCLHWRRDAQHWASSLVGLSDDSRLDRAEQVLAVKAGQAVLDMLSRKFGRRSPA